MLQFHSARKALDWWDGLFYLMLGLLVPPPGLYEGSRSMSRKMKKQYVARSGYPFTDEDAEIIGPVLERLAASGNSSADDILAEAMRIDSPLHQFYDWDLSSAARKHWLEYSRKVAKGIAYTWVVDETVHQRPVLVDVVIKDVGHQYLTPDIISGDEALSMTVVEGALRELLRFASKYRQYLEMFDPFNDAYAELFIEIDSITDSLENNPEEQLAHI